jgi:type IV pilus assembly protein PilF
VKRAALLSVLVLTACVGEQQRSNLAEAARINTQMGVDYMRSGQNDVAQAKLERALAQYPDYAPAHSAIAVLFQRLGNPAEAEQHFRRAVDLDPENPDLRNNFGQFQCSTGHAEEADRNFMIAAHDPRYTTPWAAWTNAGICAKTYDMAKAEQDFREALKTNPKFPEALAQLAVVAYKTQDYLRARAFLQRYEVESTPDAEMLAMGARIERTLGDELAARRYEIRLRREFPDSAEAAALATSSQQ